MSAHTVDPQTSEHDEVPNTSFVERERKRQYVIGITVLVVGAIVMAGIIYYFGMMATLGL